MRNVLVTLLEAVTKEALFTLKSELDESALEGVARHPAKGYGGNALEVVISA